MQLDRELSVAISSAAREVRLAESKLIQARADVESAKLMRESSKFLDNKTAMQVRYLETLNIMASQGTTRICFIPEGQDKERLMHVVT